VIEGDAVVVDLRLGQPPEVVFEFFVDPARLVQWIGIGADLDPRPGGRFRFEVAPGQYCEGRYVAVERPGRVVFSWGWTDPGRGVPPGSSEVEVVLSPDSQGTGTHLRLVHRGLETDGARLLHDDGWPQFLARLVAVAAGNTPPAYPAGDPETRRNELLATPPPPPSAGSGSGG
jgi:uncharacterized protein YndB with AHSA1/START domain